MLEQQEAGTRTPPPAAFSTVQDGTPPPPPPASYYAVVQFSESDGGTVSIVNSEWLTPRRCEVYWPPVKGSKAFEKLLNVSRTPDQTWKLYGIQRVFCETESLNEAKRKLKLSEVTSDLEAAQESSKRAVKRTKRLVSDSSYSGDENKKQIVRPPPLKKKLKIVADNIAKKDSTIKQHKQKEELNFSVLQKPSNPINSTVKQHKLNDLDPKPDSESLDEELQLITETIENREITKNYQESLEPLSKEAPPSQLTGFQSKVIDLLTHIKAQSNQMLEILKKKRTQARGTLKSEFKFPLATQEELDANESLLTNKENVDHLVSYLNTFGGKDDSKVQRIMKYLISDELACSFNFYGQHRSQLFKPQKKPFKNLILWECIVQFVVSTTVGVTAKDVEDRIKGWLKHAPERKKRAEKDNVQ